MHVHWQCPRDIWQRLVDQCHTATIFHSPVWADAIVTSGLGQIETVYAEWPDGRQALLVVELQQLWKGLVTKATIGLNGGYGGIIANGPLSPSESDSLFDTLKRRYPECAGTTNPMAGEPAPVGFTVVPAAPTRVLTLAPLDVLRQAYHQDRKQAVKRYHKHEVRVHIVTQPNAQDVREFYRLYQLEVASWRELGRNMQLELPEAWFKALFRSAAHHLRLAFATTAGETVGTAVYAVQGKQATELYLAWDRRFKAAQVSTALKEACLAEAHARGLAQMDFMASGDLDGVDRFKLSFGAVALPIWHYYQQTRRSSLLQGLKGKLSGMAPKPATGVPFRMLDSQAA